MLRLISRRYLAVVFLSISVGFAAPAQDMTDKTMKIEIALEKKGQASGILVIPLSVPKRFAHLDYVEIRDDPGFIGQLTAPSIMTESIRPAKDGLVRRDLHIDISSLTKVGTHELTINFGVL
jgi:hypothetical protein